MGNELIFIPDLIEEGLSIRELKKLRRMLIPLSTINQELIQTISKDAIIVLAKDLESFMNQSSKPCMHSRGIINMVRGLMNRENNYEGVLRTPLVYDLTRCEDEKMIAWGFYGRGVGSKTAECIKEELAATGVGIGLNSVYTAKDTYLILEAAKQQEMSKRKRFTS